MQEKLIEEIYNDMADFFGRLSVWPEFAHIDGSQEKQVALVQRVIARIGEAYIGGMELPGEEGRFGVSKHGVTVKHFWEEDVKLWRMELEAINYTGMMRFQYIYYACNREDLPWPEGETHDFNLIALHKERPKGKSR